MKEKVINKKPYIIASIINLIIVAAVFFILCLALQKPILDGFFFSSIALFFVGFMVWLSREGFFDIFAYGFRQAGSMIFSKNPTEYNDFPGYKQAKNQSREKRSKYYLVFVIGGAILLLATLIFYFVTKS